MTSPKEIVDRWVAAYNSQDWSAYEEILSPDCVIEVGARRLEGIQAVVDGDRRFAEACPDLRAVNLHQAETGRILFREDRVTGTFTKPWRHPAGNIAPTGKRFDSKLAVVIEVEDGKVVAGRFYSDPAIVAAQLGITPLPGQG